MRVSVTVKPSLNTKHWSTKSSVRAPFVNEDSLEILIIAYSFSELAQFGAKFHHCKPSHSFFVTMTPAVVLSDFRTSRWVPYGGLSNHIWRRASSQQICHLHHLPCSGRCSFTVFLLSHIHYDVMISCMGL